MSILTVEEMSHSFGERIIFDKVSFRILKGEHIALVGANGEGKSTLMKIITNQLLPDNGKVTWGSKISVGYMDQYADLNKGKTVEDILKEAFSTLFDAEQEINDLYGQLGELSEAEMDIALAKIGDMQEMLDTNDFYNINSKIQTTALGLGILELLERDASSLSGGQRTKILLAKLLLETPDILLLDEPTNYLDVEHIEWLQTYLNNYENAFVLISHDTDFVNSVINVVQHLEHKVLTRYVGDYENYLKVYAIKKEQLEIEFREQKREIAKLEDYIARNKARASTSKQAKSREKKLDKIERIEIKSENIKPQFNFMKARSSGEMIFEVENLVVGYNKPLSKPLNLKMKREQKIAIVGTNGLGKSTLLKSLLGVLTPISGEINLGNYQEIGYFQQEILEVNTNVVIDDVWNEFPNSTNKEIMGQLSRCGLTRKNIESPVNILSGGEQAKVRLCKLINKPSNILVLDEPTNHLDIHAKEELKRALQDYKGSILLVCHEPEFYKDIVTDVWNCEDWAL
ncbi:ABC-F family ATP-binding cassette domain-containing protein [Paenibacillus endoradicis]|uniref:ABC-F family ATP-binding cassette domain-containing protein n=1 Tax=Paenibacillus endoradicis TaxID=2972487 RepID=UPI00215959C9|nr:ABC-F family ATP-binding cassette domain-containing protein [Paenibacillus endoradicis]MCR8655949.1 ATP-binding cassette domain-containing protein [Paenibacillus endoradicis]MCR8658275.1 ATP-binding cassette domain-containing protein [Paenibacillus endoradicis]